MAFEFRLPVRFDDVDHAGIVYYPRYFHYFHQAFEEIFRDRLGPAGFVELLGTHRVGLPAVRAEAEFHRPLAFGDDVVIEVELDEIGRRSLALTYRARHPDHPEQVFATGRVACALIDLDTFRAIDVPPQIREIFGNL